MNLTSTRICICGAGTMGSGIAQVAAQSGYTTILFDLNTAVLEKAKASIEKSLSFLVDKHKIDAGEKEQIFQRLHFTNKITDCVADICIEAIIEKIEAKIDLFTRLATINNADTVFATNTSSLSVTAIAEKLEHPKRVIGMHFFNPPHIMKLVEIVQTKFSDSEIVDRMVALTTSMGKIPAICIDAPGFIVNRVARPFYTEALRLVEEGVANIETIDELLVASGFKMGPFALMDLIGNDINYTVSCSVYEQLHKPDRLKPSYIQAQKVAEGKLGKKTGEGYYLYAEKNK